MIETGDPPKDVDGRAGDPGAAAERQGDSSTFQVLVRLQHLRTQVMDWTAYGRIRQADTGRIGEVLWALHGMEVAARTGGLNAYARVCQHLAEQLEPLRCDANPHLMLLQELSAWIVSSDRYLRHPGNAGAVADLIGRLNALPWDSPLSEGEQGSLFRMLLQPA